jgi:cysteine desulfurase/selenocysteine lyase
MLDTSIRGDFPILSQQINGKPLIYFDNSATSQKPLQVIEKLAKYYKTINANIHRGIYYLSEKATEEYEESKRKVAKFIKADSLQEIVYTRNTTESINLVAYSLCGDIIKEGDLVLSTEMEHHSNIVPWQILQKKFHFNVEYIPILDDYTLDLEIYKKLLKKKPKLVTFVHSSNVIGTINPVKEMTKIAHKVKALVLIDGAQSAPHMKIDVSDINCDFFAFSSHKMCGPTGIGVLYGKKDLLEKISPFMGGGEMIKEVTLSKSTWNNLPYKFEAGTPDIADGIAFGAAIDYLEELGLGNIEKHEKELIDYTLGRFNELKQIEVFGLTDTKLKRGGMIAFTIKGAHPHDISQILNEDGIAIRAGNHCAQPLHTRFRKRSTARASFYMYNTKEEIDIFINSLKKVIKMFS